jgi:hypothetical protein
MSRPDEPIRLIAATHFLWAGLALEASLWPAQYLFVMVFLGFLVILGQVARITGSFIIGAIVALGLFGAAEERALATVLVVQAANLPRGPDLWSISARMRSAVSSAACNSSPA